MIWQHYKVRCVIIVFHKGILQQSRTPELTQIGLEFVRGSFICFKMFYHRKDICKWSWKDSLKLHCKNADYEPCRDITLIVKVEQTKWNLSFWLSIARLFNVVKDIELTCFGYVFVQWEMHTAFLMDWNMVKINELPFMLGHPESPSRTPPPPDPTLRNTRAQCIFLCVNCNYLTSAR